MNNGQQTGDVQWDDDKDQQGASGQVQWDDEPSTTVKGKTGDTSSVVGGFLSRAGQTAKGLWETVTAPPQSGFEAALPPGTLPLYRTARGMVGGVKRAGEQSDVQAAQAREALKSGDLVGGGLRAGQSLVTALSGADPFATGTVTDVNELEEQGKNREAIGTAAFDELMLLIGGKKPKDAPASMGRKSMARLTGAIGETGETAANLRPVLPDLADTVKRMGKQPETVGELRDVVQATTDRFENEFGQAIQPIRGKQVMPQKVSSELMGKITPNMLKTASGRAEAAALRKAAIEFQQPWTINELNLERMRRNAELANYYKKGSAAQTAATKSSIDVVIDKAVRDAASEVVYDEIGRANPKLDVRTLKQKEGSLWSLRDQLDERVGELEDKQLAYEGRTIGEKVRVGAYASARSLPHGYVSHLTELLPGGGPETYANTKVASAFRRASPARVSARRAVLALPIARLGADEDARKSLTPPPTQ